MLFWPNRPAPDEQLIVPLWQAGYTLIMDYGLWIIWLKSLRDAGLIGVIR